MMWHSPHVARAPAFIDSRALRREERAAAARGKREDGPTEPQVVEFVAENGAPRN